jgi:hypothetical protein
MKLPLGVLTALVFGAAAHGGNAMLTVQTQNTLTAIDAVPTPFEIDQGFVDPTNALANLASIATDPTATAVAPDGVGIRIRALHALASYCTAPCADGYPAHQALVQFITANHDDSAGTTIVKLRGAIEALWPHRVGTDLYLLVSLLSHPSRDVRAATAHALRDLCNTQAIAPLRTQQGQETSDQVKLAISEALRVLSQPSPCQ